MPPRPKENCMDDEDLRAQHTVRSIGELLTKASTLPMPDTWMFRGVHTRAHRPIPSIARTRHNSVRQAHGEIGPDEERLALRRFRDQVRPHVGLDISNDLEWLVLAQHHGMPTRLLDWTTSILVAAYFATATIQATDGTPDTGLIVGATRPPEVRTADRLDPFAVDQVRLVIPPHVSDRVTRQAGLLTLHPQPLPLLELTAVPFYIPSESKLAMKMELDRLG